MRPICSILAACPLAFLVACPGGGPPSRGDAIPGDGNDEVPRGNDVAEPGGSLGEETGDLPGDEGLWDALEFDGTADPGDAILFEVPRVLCTSDEECEAVLGEPGECVRVFCDLGAGECRAGPAPDGEPCALQTLCEEDGLCWAGVCRGNPIVCDDDNPCTEDACHPSVGCVFSDNTSPCDDGNECTVNDTCQNGRCVGTPVCGCQTDADCLPYEDGDLCNGTLRCEKGTCLVDPATVVHCGPPAKGPCWIARCIPKTGLCEEVPAPDGSPCDDGNTCTAQDRCANGGCSGTAVICEDQNPCTADSCDPAKGCVFGPANDGAPCSDGNACTTGDHCAGGACVGTARVCDDQNPCTTDFCDEKTGACVFTPNTAPCDDGNACTTGDACQEGVCLGAPRVCDDINSCTADSCDPAVGCVFQPANDGKKCSDGNLCTTDDVCSSGKCAGTPKVCDDQNPCTTDFCDEKTGACVFTPNTAPCDDGNACTTGDACQGGQCMGTPISCNDNNECTTDSCDPDHGCVFQPVPNWPPVPCDGPWHVCWNGQCVGLPGGP